MRIVSANSRGGVRATPAMKDIHSWMQLLQYFRGDENTFIPPEMIKKIEVLNGVTSLKSPEKNRKFEFPIGQYDIFGEDTNLEVVLSEREYSSGIFIKTEVDLNLYVKETIEKIIAGDPTARILTDMDKRTGFSILKVIKRAKVDLDKSTYSLEIPPTTLFIHRKYKNLDIFFYNYYQTRFGRSRNVLQKEQNLDYILDNSDNKLYKRVEEANLDYNLIFRKALSEISPAGQDFIVYLPLNDLLLEGWSLGDLDIKDMDTDPISKTKRLVIGDGVNSLLYIGAKEDPKEYKYAHKYKGSPSVIYMLKPGEKINLKGIRNNCRDGILEFVSKPELKEISSYEGLLFRRIDPPAIKKKNKEEKELLAEFLKEEEMFFEVTNLLKEKEFYEKYASVLEKCADFSPKFKYLGPKKKDPVKFYRLLYEIKGNTSFYPAYSAFFSINKDDHDINFRQGPNGPMLDIVFSIGRNKQMSGGQYKMIDVLSLNIYGDQKEVFMSGKPANFNEDVLNTYKKEFEKKHFVYGENITVELNLTPELQNKVIYVRPLN